MEDENQAFANLKLTESCKKENINLVSIGHVGINLMV